MSNYEFIKNSDNNGNSLYKYVGLAVMGEEVVRIAYQVSVSKNGTEKAYSTYINGEYVTSDSISY